jgi:hypothetical protein
MCQRSIYYCVVANLNFSYRFYLVTITTYLYVAVRSLLRPDNGKPPILYLLTQLQSEYLVIEIRYTVLLWRFILKVLKRLLFKVHLLVA